MNIDSAFNFACFHFSTVSITVINSGLLKRRSFTVNVAPQAASTPNPAVSGNVQVAHPSSSYLLHILFKCIH